MPGLEPRTFQFYDSTIKSEIGAFTTGPLGAFQFYDSTIKRYKQRLINRWQSNFNSTIVRLKDFFLLSPENSHLDFNSTIVRLKDMSISGSLRISAFQFYDSTIKRGAGSVEAQSV